MDDKSKGIPAIPRETARLAKAAFGGRNFYILVGDHWEHILKDFPAKRLPDPKMKASSLTLALVTFFQILEGLTDEQAEDAARTRIEWKYALHLAVHAPVFSRDALCLFRQRIISETDYHREFQSVADRLVLLDPCQRMEQQQGMALVRNVCALNRLHLILEAMSQVLQFLAARYPDWLRRAALPHWYARYADRQPWRNSTDDLSVPILKVGADMAYLLEAISRSEDAGLADSVPVQELAQLWSQHFERLDADEIRLRPHCAFCLTRVPGGPMEAEIF